MENEVEQLQEQINNLAERTFNNTVLDAKDGFFITASYNQVLSDYTIEIDFDAKSSTITKSFGASDLPFFIAKNPVEVFWVAEAHLVAGSDAGAVTMDIVKLTDGQAVAAGTSILASTFDMKSTANTVVSKEGKELSSSRVLKTGERLALDFTGTLTDLAGVQVTLYCKFPLRGNYK